jgi:hypothetical protein
MPEYETVKCGKCKLPVSTQVAWFDPYKNKGCNVHFECLSKKRKDEINHPPNLHMKKS